MKILNKWASKSRERSGQALVEFMFVGFILLFMLFAMIDFSRAISMKQVLIDISREGANEAARGAGDTVDATISNAMAAVIAGANPLNINQNGQVIISAVLNTGSGTYKITNQLSEGALTQPSKIGMLNAIGSGATNSAVVMPLQANNGGEVPQPNQTSYIAEVYYNFQAATSLGNVMVGGMKGFTVTNQFYDVAYF
jgi:Flp pilus assembly protein TadG